MVAGYEGQSDPTPLLKSSGQLLMEINVAPDTVTNGGLYLSDRLKQKNSENICSRSLPTRNLINSSGPRNRGSSNLWRARPPPGSIDQLEFWWPLLYESVTRSLAVSDGLILSVDPRD